MRASVRLAALALIAVALGAGIRLASRGTSPDRRNLDALVTVGGDLVHDATRPVMDLTRLSSAEEIELGRAIDAEIRAAMPVGGDAALEGYLARLTARLAGSAGRPDIPFTAAVVRSPEINAFAVAGGRIYVTEGMLSLVDSEAELASVLGHEISHVVLRHCVERLQIAQAAEKISPGLGALARLGYEIMLRGFSEEQELAADVNGALLSAAASYDPWAANELLGRLQERLEPPGRTPTRNPVVEVAAAIPEAFGRYMATHPPADQRIEAIRRRLESSPGSWRGLRLYLGRTNLAARRSMTEDPREDEWITRLEPATTPVVPIRPAGEPKAELDAKKIASNVYDETADAKQQIAAALVKTSKNNRRVLIQWGANWCQWCFKLRDLYGRDPKISHELLYEYDVIYVDAGGKSNKNMDLARSYGADLAAHGFPYLTILDSDGKAVANQETGALENKDQKTNPGHDPQGVLDFLTRHQATHQDGQEILDAGFAAAKKDGKLVFLHFGAPSCARCAGLEGWMNRPDVKAILGKQFVDIKLDTDRNTSGPDILERYAGSDGTALPWFVVLDGQGKAKADSNGANGDIALPATDDEIARFELMLRKTAPKLNAADVKALVESLKTEREASVTSPRGRLSSSTWARGRDAAPQAGKSAIR